MGNRKNSSTLLIVLYQSEKKNDALYHQFNNTRKYLHSVYYVQALLQELISLFNNCNLIAIKLNLINLRLVSLVSSNKEIHSQRNQVTY